MIHTIVRLSARLGVAVCVVLVAGCAVTDPLEVRSRNINEELAGSRREMILTNVLRASRSLPLQFTEIASVTGQQAGQAGLNLSFPYNLTGGGNLVGGISPNSTASQSTQFAVSSLNTKEFYSGLQTPISPQLISLLLNSGFPKRVVFNVLFSEIEIEKSGIRTRFYNDAVNESQLQIFVSAVSALANKGLTTEEVAVKDKIGPPLSSDAIRDPRVVAELLKTSDTAPSVEDLKNGTFQLVRTSKKPRFCFDPVEFQSEANVPQSGPQEEGPVEAIKQATVPSKDLMLSLQDATHADTTIMLDESDFCRSTAFGPAAKGQPTVRIRTRSLEGVFSYLGRLEKMAEDTGVPELGWSSNPLPFVLFELSRTDSTGAIKVQFEGETFYLASGADPNNESGKVVQLVATLLALQSSAKDIPAPAVLSILN